MSSSTMLPDGVNPYPTVKEPPNPYVQLFKIGIGALKFFPPLFFRSIFGTPLQWLPPHRKNSEYTILSPYRPLRAAKYLVDVTVPAFNHEPGPLATTFLPPVITDLFWRPSTYFCQPDPFDRQTSFLNEEWFYINGICTNTDVAKLNTEQLTEMFMRPITCIQNQTASFWLDLYQCAVGKEFKTNPKLTNVQTMTEPAVKALVAIVQALANPNRDKIVLICHSQGTIIAANLLRALSDYRDSLNGVTSENIEEDDLMTSIVKQYFDVVIDSSYDESQSAGAANSVSVEDNAAKPDRVQNLMSYLKRLEVYTVANCATDMKYLAFDDQGLGVPFIENFANQFDVVARLGVISPYSWQRDNSREDDPVVDIDGNLYEKLGMHAWGHLLNAHYLFGMPVVSPLTGKTTYEPSADYVLTRPDPHARYSKTPRLYSYMAGGSPKRHYLAVEQGDESSEPEHFAVPAGKKDLVPDDA